MVTEFSLSAADVKAMAGINPRTCNTGVDAPLTGVELREAALDVAFGTHALGFGIDWVSARVKGIGEARAWFEAATGLDGFKDLVGRRGMHGYEAGYEGPYGLKILYSDGDALVILPGSACQAFGMRAVVDLLARCVRCTRVDVVRDLPMGAVVPKLATAVNEGRVMGCLTTAIHRSREGVTVALGSRQSEVYCRAYDRRGVDRVELECKGRTADDVAGMIAGYFASGGAGWSLQEVWAGLVGRFQVKVAGGAHRYRAAVAGWWSEVLTSFSQVITATSPKMSLDTCLVNLRKQWGAKIAALRQVFEDWELLDIVSENARKSDDAIIWQSERCYNMSVGLA